MAKKKHVEQEEIKRILDYWNYYDISIPIYNIKNRTAAVTAVDVQEGIEYMFFYIFWNIGGRVKFKEIAKTNELEDILVDFDADFINDLGTIECINNTYKSKLYA